MIVVESGEKCLVDEVQHSRPVRRFRIPVHEADDFGDARCPVCWARLVPMMTKRGPDVVCDCGR